MNFRHFFEDFNPCRFVVFSMLFLFILLFSLRLDNYITCSYWLIFMPLWLWKFLMLFGFIIGSIIWCRQPQYRQDNYTHYKAMCLSVVSQTMLFLFEIFSCYKLESINEFSLTSGTINLIGNAAHNNNNSNNELRWVFIFIPLITLSLLGIGLCIWSMKNNRSCELELICAINILLFVFIPLRLDQLIDWSWAVVFIPLWIVMSVAIVLEVYGLILAIILCRSPDLLPDQRRRTFSITLGYSLVVFPLLIFQVFLVQLLDKDIDSNFTTVSIPLLFVLFVTLCLSFKIRGGNPWWFGIRRNFCHFLLEVFPLLQEYGNVSYKCRNFTLLCPFIGECQSNSNTSTTSSSSHDNNTTTNDNTLTNQNTTDLLQNSQHPYGITINDCEIQHYLMTNEAIPLQSRLIDSSHSRNNPQLQQCPPHVLSMEVPD